MGALRLFLAISVVIAHTGPIFGMELMPANEAVRIFFVISGFYMALVLSGKYRGKPMLFYSNRFMRLYPMFLISILAILAIEAAAPLLPHGTAGGRFIADAMAGNWRSPELLAIIPNLTMFGGDIFYCLLHGATGWHFGFGAEALASDPTAFRTGVYLLNPPAWSIGIELWFYLLAPAILPLRTRWIALAALASLGLQLWIDHLQPWASYFFFPANLCFFLFGVLGYRASTTSVFASASARWGALITVAALAAIGLREFIPLFRNYSWMHYTLAVLAIPFVFDRMKDVRWDRWVGEMSYPLYILHWAALSLSLGLIGSRNPWLTLGIVLPAAAAGVYWVEAPLERWRAKRARGVATGIHNAAARASPAE